MTPKSILLISPPITKPCEPPAGIAKLAGALRANGIDCRVYDAGLDCLLGLLEQPLAANDTWTRRALNHREENLAALRAADLYRNRDRYKRAVMDLNRILHMAGQPAGFAASLSNFASQSLSPVRSADLVRAAEQFESNLFYPLFSRSLAAFFSQREPEIFGFSINFMSQALCAFAMIGYVRKRLPGTAIVCGGGLVTSWMNIPGFESPFGGLIDDMICGPGENWLIERCTEKSAPEPSVTGCDFSSFDLDRYLAPVRVLPYSTSRGCYWKKCAFCPETAENSVYLTEAPAVIGIDLQRLRDRIGAGLIHFLDNALSPKFMAHLIEHPPGVAWYGFARITRHLTDPNFVKGLRNSGCVMLKLGVESGDQAVLDALSKGIDIAMASRALSALHRVGIATYVYLLFGTPAEDEAAALRTLAFTVDHADCIDFLNLAIFNLPAHGSEAGRLDTADFYAGDLSLYREFLHPKGWGRSRVRPFLSKVFKKQPGIQEILNNDPPFFTSNHAPFFHLQTRMNM
ncbi:radical SAM protein [Desulfosarcina widdelii]|uniref:Radical SAM protein n=1 Tax=Desulfosarcina widdelii TaxID=947919 RepID=A0A5K7Z880_9BACT|nr:radical SAM protein [Desulfosarcina widdelii]BBO78232.1 radical SAM protein [Desulfosarcina widdelii]